jgi:hypothetical protein
MMPAKVHLKLGELNLEILPTEGGVLTNFKVFDLQFLAQTPWAGQSQKTLDIAEDEAAWVKKWRGGWQLCAPNVGDAKTSMSQRAFHGLASQSKWEVMSQDSSSVSLEWQDAEGVFKIQRKWKIEAENQISVSSAITNLTNEQQPIAIAEHLILGGDFLKPVSEGYPASLEYSPNANIAELDYSGKSTGISVPSTSVDSRWRSCTQGDEARVFSITDLDKSHISVEVAGVEVLLNWFGLSNALIWQEFGTTLEDPWLGEVFALGIEPTNIPHGAGADRVSGPFILGEEVLRWGVNVTVKNKEKK